MSQPTPTQTEIKQLLKQALVELLEENKDRLRDFITEVLEDLALIHAIRAGEKTEEADREEVDRLLWRR
jgi:hypothetical protein